MIFVVILLKSFHIKIDCVIWDYSFCSRQIVPNEYQFFNTLTEKYPIPICPLIVLYGCLLASRSLD